MFTKKKKIMCLIDLWGYGEMFCKGQITFNASPWQNQVLQSRLYWFTHYNMLSYGGLFGKTQWLVISLLLIEMSNEASMAPLTKHICKKAIRGADRLVYLIKEIFNCKGRSNMIHVHPFLIPHSFGTRWGTFHFYLS